MSSPNSLDLHDLVEANASTVGLRLLAGVDSPGWRKRHDLRGLFRSVNGFSSARRREGKLVELADKIG